MNLIKFLFLILLVSFLAGCATNSSVIDDRSAEGNHQFVRKVDYSDVPRVKELAEHAREIGNENYPKILALLTNESSKFPQQFDIIFKSHLRLRQFGEQEPAGYVVGTTVYLDADVFLNPTNSDWIGDDPTNFTKVLVHEMAHVAQQYKSKVPEYWREGIAEFVRYKLGFTNGYRCPECSEEFPSYTSGYTCAGAFLLYLDSIYGLSLVRQLNSELQHGSYSDTFFLKATGKNLNELWIQFQTTSAYTPTAARINKLHEALGYKDSNPPKDVVARFEKFIKEQPEDFEIFEINQFLASAKKNKQPVDDIWTLTRLYLYFTQPGGTPNALLYGLKNQGRLPGMSKDDHGSLDEFLKFSDMNPADYANSQTFHAHKMGDSFTYNYTISRKSQNDGWKLERAWRTDKNKKVVEEYSVQ
jgi:hypothetical protein